jgi:hypothetical protein
MEPLLEQWGLAPEAVGMVAMLRNTVPDRSFTPVQVQSVFAYSPEGTVNAGLEVLRASGHVAGSEDALRLTERGRSLVADIYAATTDAVGELWSGHEDGCRVLLPLTGNALAAAYETGGAGFSLMAPPHERAGAPKPVLLAERLTPLRFHRYDAHVAAWRASGLTAQQVQELAASPQREAVEAATNRRAGLPYAVLTADERVALLEGLCALPG